MMISCCGQSVRPRRFHVRYQSITRRLCDCRVVVQEGPTAAAAADGLSAAAALPSPGASAARPAQCS
jgi:hypothetical protein